MKKFILFVFFFSWFHQYGQIIEVAHGKLELYKDFPSQYVKPRDIAVWLPENYSQKKKFSVLYMHDGQMLFDAEQTWNKQEWGVDETISKLIKQEEIQNVIVVGIYNSVETRHHEYFPQKPFESLHKKEKEIVTEALIQNGRINETFEPFSDLYLKYLVEEVKPFIDKTYSIRKDQSTTFIAGSSMGGLISLYAVCEYPEVFGGAACLSTHWPGIFSTENNPIPEAFYTYLKAKLPPPQTHKIYFDYGTATLDALYEPLQKKVDEIMVSKNFSSTQWLTLKFEGEEHSENAWKKRLSIPLLFLLKK
jgi:enterochelin esterase-like enzyme